VRDSSKYFLLGNETDSSTIAFGNFQLDPQGYWFELFAMGNESNWKFFNKSLQPQSDSSYSKVKFLQSIVTDTHGSLMRQRPNNMTEKFQTGSIYLVGDSNGKYFFNSVKKTNFPNQPFKNYSETKGGWLIEMQNGKFGIADSNYQFWLIEPEYDKLEHKKRKTYSFEKGGNAGELELGK
jgi:hypothetical protein